MTRRTLALLTTALLVLTACVEGTGPDAEACAAPTVEIQLAVAADAMDPNGPSVCRDQDVSLVITPTVDGVFHIHGYDEEVPATEIRDGAVIALEFTAAHSGQFSIELHTLDDPEGVAIGVFTVHEP